MNIRKITNKGLILFLLMGLQANAKIEGFSDASYETVKVKTEKGHKRVDKNLVDLKTRTEKKRVELENKQQATKVKLENLVERIGETNSKLMLIIGILKLNEDGLMNCFSKQKNTKESILRQKELRLKEYADDPDTRKEIEEVYNKGFKKMQEDYETCLDDNAYERTKLADIKNELKQIKHDIDFADDNVDGLETEQKNILSDLNLIQSQLKLIEDGKYDKLK